MVGQQTLQRKTAGDLKNTSPLKRLLSKIEREKAKKSQEEGEEEKKDANKSLVKEEDSENRRRRTVNDNTEEGVDGDEGLHLRLRGRASVPLKGQSRKH